METLIYTLLIGYLVGVVLAFGRINAIYNSRKQMIGFEFVILYSLMSWVGFVAGWLYYNDNPHQSKFLDYEIK